MQCIENGFIHALIADQEVEDEVENKRKKDGVDDVDLPERR